MPTTPPHAVCFVILWFIATLTSSVSKHHAHQTHVDCQGAANAPKPPFASSMTSRVYDMEGHETCTRVESVGMGQSTSFHRFAIPISCSLLSVS
ncbi:hypothetical protein C8R45DRAFT_196032 [Mycena sanguinolenta]|nr:hypothetical protein C8R45DRAFT_196032 [Mycena sanguinolenta]